MSMLSSHTSYLIPHTYTARWRYRGKFMFRVWPMCKETHIRISREATIPVSGLLATAEGRMEAWNRANMMAHDCRFELNDGDVELLTSAATAGAEIKTKRMVVHAPGTLDVRVKKECWLEIPYIAYKDAPERTRNSSDMGWCPVRVPYLKVVRGGSVEEALKSAGVGYGKIVMIRRDEDIDEDIILREVLENDAAIVFPVAGVSGDRVRKVVERSLFWTVPGRRPDEDGGLLRGYQFSDRFFRYCHTVGPEFFANRMAEMLERAHEVTREKGRSARRKYFVEETINRFAERVGMSRQRVTARFLDDGIVEWLIRSVEGVKPILMRDTQALLSGRVTDAVNALECYYRALEWMGK